MLLSMDLLEVAALEVSSSFLFQTHRAEVFVTPSQHLRSFDG